MSVHKIAICDDVALEREMLYLLLNETAKEQRIYQFASGEELLASKQIFDLVFLDIYMSGMTGMETARRLQQKSSRTLIVFLTSSPDFAVESYEVHAFDYILKPLQPQRLAEIWERFISRPKQNNDFLILNSSAGTEKLPYEQIEYLESDRHYVTIHMADNSELRVQGRLDSFEQELDDSRFLRCHKSFLINLSLTQAMGDSFLMQSGKHVAYRKREKKLLQRLFCDYISDRQSQI